MKVRSAWQWFSILGIALATSGCGGKTTPSSGPELPAQPTALTAGSITANSLVLSWTASSSSAGVAGYNVFRNGNKLGSISSTSYPDSGLAASTTYSYAVSAYDAAGNTSSLSSTLSVTTLSLVTLAQPTDFSAVENATYCNVILSWNAASHGSLGTAQYDILRNGTLLASTPNLTFNDTSAAANTTYSYAVETEDTAGNRSASTNPISISSGDCTPAASFRLGATYSTTGSTYSIWSPTSSNVQLNLNGTLYTMAPVASPPNGYTNVYSITVPGNQNLVSYNFKIGGNTSRDPYGVMVQPGTNNDITMDPSQITLQGGWSPTPSLTNRVDSIIYETHVREFTNDASSGVPTADRGYLEGMTDAGTTVNGVAGAPSTGIDHLVDMGVTHIQIMPLFDSSDCVNAAAENTCFNWGYDPLSFNVPTANYSQTPTNYANRVLELKQMIDGFHKKGIRVVMDVVYNHTASKSVFTNITPEYYLTTDVTGIGNTVDGSNPMVARLIQDSLEYWVTQYNVDGFRFDLLGVFPLSTVNQWGTYLTTMYPKRNLLLYGEPFVGVGSPAPTALNLGNIGTIPSAHVGAFNAAFRTALKGANDDAGGNTGFLFDQSTSDSLFGSYVAGRTWPSNGAPGYGPISLGVAGSPVPTLPATANTNVSPAAFSAAPEQALNYISVHDNLCLYDKVTSWQQANNATGQNLTGSLITYGFGTILTAQGIPFLYEGDEFRRTKSNNSNTFNIEYDLVWANLQTNATDAATYAYVKSLIALRKAHPSLRFSTWNEVSANLLSNQKSASLVVTTINSSAAVGDTWTQAIVVNNSSASTQTIALPSGTWFVAVYGQTIEPTGTAAGLVGGSNTNPTVAPSGITIFYEQ